MTTKSSTWESLPSSELTTLSDAEVVMPFEPGELIAGKYRVREIIGTGGMAFVVSALHVELGDVVALKFLRPEARDNEEIVARFAREARAAVRIKSEHVARVLDVGALPDGVPFIVMEHLEGHDLCDLLAAQGPLRIKRAVEYVLQVCEALAAAHAVGVVHRDIKPENLFLIRHAQGIDSVKVLDFGISKVALTGSAYESGEPLVQTQSPMGSPVYMSPEQLRSAGEVDSRTDIWSLGCVLYELLTGIAAFDAPSLLQLSATILEEEPVPLRELVPEAPEGLEQVVLRCLRKSADERYQSVAELAVALYPFGPRRARISAERCYYLLQATGSAKDFELPTIPPPPDAPESERDGAGPESSIRTTTPAALDVESPRVPPRSRARLAWLVAATIVGVTSYLIIGRSPPAVPRDEPPPRVATKPTALPALPPSPRPIEEPPPRPTVERRTAMDDAPPVPGPAQRAKATPHATRPPAAPRPKLKTVTAVPTAPNPPSRQGDGEVDVGF